MCITAAAAASLHQVQNMVALCRSLLPRTNDTHTYTHIRYRVNSVIIINKYVMHAFALHIAAVSGAAVADAAAIQIIFPEYGKFITFDSMIY